LHGSLLHSGLGHRNFLNNDISQGSVATRLRCGGIVSDDFVADLLVNLPVKEFLKNQSIFGEVMGKITVARFWTQCTLYAISGRSWA